MVLVIVKALDILEYVARDPEKTYTLSEISQALGLNQATCSNILKTLVAKNYVEHVGRKVGYRLGPMAFNLTNNPAYNQNLILAARDVMEDLTAEVNETSLLGIIRNQKRFVLHLVNSDQDLQVRSKSERNVYETATGRLLLAFMSAKEQEQFILSNGLPTPEVWKEASTREGLDLALRKIARDELAITYSVKHIIGLAVPIRKGDKVIAALSIFMPESRFSATKKKEIIRALQEAERKIEARLNS